MRSREDPTAGGPQRAFSLQPREQRSSPFRQHHRPCRIESDRPRPRHPQVAGCHSSRHARHPGRLSGRPPRSTSGTTVRSSSTLVSAAAATAFRALVRGRPVAHASTTQLQRARDLGLHRWLASSTDCLLRPAFAHQIVSTEPRGREIRQIGIGAGSFLAPGLIESGTLRLPHENRRSGRRAETGLAAQVRVS